MLSTLFIEGALQQNQAPLFARHAGVIPGRFLDHFGITFMSFGIIWGHFGMFFAFWDILLGHFGEHFGAMLSF